MPDEKPSRESRRAMQRRLKRPPGRPRNPALEFRFEPTKADRELVKLLAGYALPHDRIVKAIRNPHTRRPIGIGTLYKHFADELDAGATEVDALCTEMLTKRLREGNVTALIWVTKNRWGWKDVVEQQGRSAVDLSIQIKSREELAKQLEKHGLPPIDFGYDKPVLDDLEPRFIEHNGSAED
jgi:hypothetical protein